MTVTCTETAECDKWAEIVALAQQGNKKMLGVILQAFDIKLRKIAHTSAYKGFEIPLWQYRSGFTFRQSLCTYQQWC